MNDDRLNPDDLLKLINETDKASKQGKLRIFLGMSAGVGKTFAMLKAAHQKKNEGVYVVIGAVETHGRAETANLIQDLKIIGRKKYSYRNTEMFEMDLETILKLKPDLVVVDELAHTNVPGSRHEKRYQDVIELLESGIDVYTALNVQHLESRKDSVEAITGITIRETVPDSILDRAHLIEVIDIAPSELLKRLSEGKIYLGDKAAKAADAFFKEDKLTALREIALRLTAERVDQDLQKLSITKNGKSWQINERLLVAVSHSPYSEKLIRTARRLASNLDSPWMAVYIDTGLQLSDDDQAQLIKNLNLARELNAEVITTTDVSLLTALKRICRQKNVTQIILGRPRRRWLQDLIEGGSLLQKLVKETPDVDLHIVSTNLNFDHKVQLNLWDQLSLYRTKTGLKKYWYTLCFMIFMTSVGVILEPFLGYRTVGFIFLLGVLIVGVFGSLGAVMWAAVLSAFTWNFIFIPPRFTFVISASEDVILCFVYFVVALIIGFLTQRIRFREQIIREREERTNVLYQILKDISSSQNKAEFINKITQRIGLLLKGHSGVVLKSKNEKLDFNKNNSYLSDLANLDEKEQAVALWCFENKKSAGWSTETLSQSNALYIPLLGVNECVGVFIFSPDRKLRKLGPDQIILLNSIVNQLGVSIEHYFLGQRLIEAQRLKDSEQLHQTLLNSISHEMRTPLTAVLGIAAALQSDDIKDQYIKNLASDLTLASERLNRVIENLLDMSRLNSGVLALNLEWQDLNDIIGSVVQKLSKSLSAFQFTYFIDPSIHQLIRVDFRLIEHALSNVLLNATQYAGTAAKINLEVTIVDHKIKIIISDSGAGIPKESIPFIFEKFYRVPGSAPGGTGLGLSIVKSIIELHKGQIRYELKNDLINSCPSQFIIELPIEKQPQIPQEVNS